LYREETGTVHVRCTAWRPSTRVVTGNWGCGSAFAGMCGMWRNLACAELQSCRAAFSWRKGVLAQLAQHRACQERPTVTFLPSAAEARQVQIGRWEERWCLLEPGTGINPFPLILNNPQKSWFSRGFYTYLGPCMRVSCWPTAVSWWPTASFQCTMHKSGPDRRGNTSSDGSWRPGRDLSLRIY
jgi:hypothetical protein